MIDYEKLRKTIEDNIANVENDRFLLTNKHEKSGYLLAMKSILLYLITEKIND